ncbi:MAG: Sll0314/Alr1548 family TPR repeat-containing protein [Spirulinaceae cyanobacterium]
MAFARPLSPQRLSQRLLSLAVATTLTTLTWSTAAWAGDPFRDNNPSNISAQTEAAFEAMFKEGDYRRAQEIIAGVRDDGDPLVPALQAALAYNLNGTTQDNNNYVARTRNAAQALLDQSNASTQDQIRGNLYLAAASFMEGAYAFKQNNNDYVAAALKVQDVFRYLRRAEQVEQAAGISDPELNLVKGYIELLLSVNLPLSNPQNAIANLRSNAAPDYLVHRGIAIAYRDLGFKIGNSNVGEAAAKYQQAQAAVNRVLAIAPNNPEVQYLKAQILHEWSKLAGQEDPEMLNEAIELFAVALDKDEQLPSEIPAQICRELRIAEGALAQIDEAPSENISEQICRGR